MRIRGDSMNGSLANVVPYCFCCRSRGLAGLSLSEVSGAANIRPTNGQSQRRGMAYSLIIRTFSNGWQNAKAKLMFHDVCYAFRALRQNPSFALTAIISIA